MENPNADVLRFERDVCASLLNELKFGEVLSSIAECSVQAAFQQQCVGPALANALQLLLPGVRHFRYACTPGLVPVCAPFQHLPPLTHFAHSP